MKERQELEQEQRQQRQQARQQQQEEQRMGLLQRQEQEQHAQERLEKARSAQKELQAGVHVVYTADACACAISVCCCFQMTVCVCSCVWPVNSLLLASRATPNQALISPSQLPVSSNQGLGCIRVHNISQAIDAVVVVFSCRPPRAGCCARPDVAVVRL